MSAPKSAPPAKKSPLHPQNRKRNRNFVAVGNIRIPWRRYKDGRTVIDPPYPVRKRRTFTDHAEALAEARRIATELNAGGVELSAISVADRAAFAQACEAAREFGTTFSGALAEWREARALLAAGAPGVSLAAALAAGVATLRQPVHLVGTVAEELLINKAGRDLDERYARDLRVQLADFARAFPGDLAGISAGAIEKWIRARKTRGGADLSPKRYNHVRATIIQLFLFARDRGYLPDKKSAAEQTTRAQETEAHIGVFAPAEIATLLAHVEEDWLPWLAIAAFSGVRSEEIALSKNAAKRKDCLRWEDFDWIEGEIIVRANVSKIRRPRRIPIHPNLLAWLAPWRDKRATGPVAPGGDSKGQAENYRARFLDQLARLAADHAPGVRGQVVAWPNNGLRHSFGSYRMAQLHDREKCAHEMGNTPAIVSRRYDNPRPPSEAAAWFGVMPEGGAENVVPIAAKGGGE